MNIDLKIALIRRYGSQAAASPQLKIREAKLSSLSAATPSQTNARGHSKKSV